MIHNHLGVDYDVSHLRQVISPVAWTGQDGTSLKFSVRLRYANHAYSEELKRTALAGEAVFQDQNNIQRIFCPTRHAHSISLPTMMQGLFTKPTTTVLRTSREKNWTFFCLKMTPSLAPGSRYYVFMRLRSQLSEQPGVHWLDLWVESAYSRIEKVPTDRAWPFGRLLERVALGLPI